jgi:hypothetical protein
LSWNQFNKVNQFSRTWQSQLGFAVITADMGVIRVAIKLPLFLIAEAALWCAALFGSHVLFLDRGWEALQQHRRLVDWLRRAPRT